MNRMPHPAPIAALLLAAAAWAHEPAVQQRETPARAREAYARALELDAEGRSSESLPLLWEAAGLAPGDPEIQNRLGEALDRMGALDAAMDAFRRALAARPDFRKAADNLVLTLGKAGRSPEAIERARAIVAAAPRDANAHFTLGLAQSEADVTEAIGTFRRALELDPRHALARYNLALVLKRADRTTEAIDELQRTLEIAPRAEAHYTLGVIYWQQGDLERAERALRAAEAAEPRYADAHYTLGVVLAARGDRKGAIDALRRAIALRPDLPGAHYSLGQVLRQGGDAAAGDAHLAEADRLQTAGRLEHEARVWTSTGTARLEAGDPADAVRHYKRAIAIHEAYAPAHYQLGRALERLGQTAAARAAFARARELNPSLVAPRDP
jgi:tetratricopeptide (TPR) repeat protein